jgi:hypothetical protein
MPYQDSNVTGGKVALKHSGVAGETKPALVPGELALNSADGVLYYRDGQFPGAVGFKRIVSLTQAAYDDLTPDADTLYIVSAE